MFKKLKRVKENLAIIFTVQEENNLNLKEGAIISLGDLRNNVLKKKS
jgi:hypothetical protein